MRDQRYLFGDLAVRIRSTVSATAPSSPAAASVTSPTRPGRAVFVLVHGIGTSHRYFERLHTELARTADVYSIDLPGFGGVPKPSTSPSVTEMAWLLASALDRVGVTDAVIVGHSMGAQWAVELGIVRPDLAAGVVVIGPVTDDRHRTLWSQMVGLGRDITGETLPTNAVVFADYLRCGPAWYLRQSRDMLSYPIDRRVALLQAPLLIVRGGNDPIASLDWCRRLRAAASDARVAVIPGHRHNAHYTAPVAVSGAIRHFVETT
jgi:pimeloyl-ACP methyl ester carboxylesterase